MIKPGGMSIVQMLFGFDGRIRRRDFWLWSFVNLAAGLAVLAVAAMAAVLIVSYTQSYAHFLWHVPLTLVALVPFGWIILALQAKRQHDIGRSMQWWVNYIPFVGLAWVIGECYLRAGMADTNAYGPSPKAGR